MGKSVTHHQRIQIVHKNKTPELIREIISFWQEIGIRTGNQKPEERAKQALSVVRDEQGKIIAVTTVFISEVPNFNNYLFVYRCVIHPDCRIPGLMHEMALSACQYLESIYRDINPYCIGVLAKLESPLLKKNRFVHSKTGMHFAGFAPDGDPLRVYFFKGARF